MEVHNPLLDSPIYSYVHRFLLDVRTSLPADLNSQQVFAEVCNLCQRAVTDPTPGENLSSRYVDELQQRTDNRRLTEFILCLSWVVLTVQDRPSYALSRFKQRLQPLIKHSAYYSRARQLAVTIRQHERHIQTDFHASIVPAKVPVPSRKKVKELVDREVVREEIITWVSKVRPLLDDTWKADFPKIWEDVLDMQEVKEKVYDWGKQKNTNFNQYLVGNILYYMFEECGAWSENKEYNASAVCMTLLGTTEHQLRKELAKYPPEDVKNRLYKYFTEKLEQ